MDRRTDFWRGTYRRQALSNGPEHAINIYSERGWLARQRTFAATLDKRLKTSPPPANALALDLGCGTGAYGRVLDSRGYRVVAADLVEDMALLARKSSDSALLPVVADAVTAPFADDAFDAVVCVGLISIVSDPDALLREIARVAKPGAPIFLDTLNAAYFHSVIRRLTGSDRLPPEVDIRSSFPPTLRRQFARIIGPCRVVPVYSLDKPFRFLNTALARSGPLWPVTMPAASAFFLVGEKR